LCYCWCIRDVSQLSQVLSLQTDGIFIHSILENAILNGIRSFTPTNPIIGSVSDRNSLLCVFEKGNFVFLEDWKQQKSYVRNDKNAGIHIPPTVTPTRMILALGHIESDGKCVFGVAKSGHFYVWPIKSNTHM